MTSPVATLRRSTVFFFGEMAIASQPRPDVDVEHGPEHLLRRHQEARLLRDHAADVVGQPAVRVRDVRPALHHEDLGLLVQPAQARRARRPARHSANDDDFHASYPLLRGVQPPMMVPPGLRRRSTSSRPSTDSTCSKRTFGWLPESSTAAMTRRYASDLRCALERLLRFPASRGARWRAPVQAPRRCRRRRNPAGPARGPGLTAGPRARQRVGRESAGSSPFR